MEARFNLKTVECDPEGYYYPRWDQAIPVSVVASTQQEAINLADQMLGPVRRWPRRYRLVNIEPAPAPKETA